MTTNVGTLTWFCFAPCNRIATGYNKDKLPIKSSAATSVRYLADFLELEQNSASKSWPNFSFKFLTKHQRLVKVGKILLSNEQGEVAYFFDRLPEFKIIWNGEKIGRISRLWLKHHFFPNTSIFEWNIDLILKFKNSIFGGRVVLSIKYQDGLSSVLD